MSTKDAGDPGRVQRYRSGGDDQYLCGDPAGRHQGRAACIVLVLMVVSIITVGSTIRLSVFARRREIEIMKYVGATNRLVTLPFFVEGLTMGLISGILTCGARSALAATAMWSMPPVVWAASGRCSWGTAWCRWQMPSADHRGNKPAQRCRWWRAPPWAVCSPPQTSECVTERSRVL